MHRRGLIAGVALAGGAAVAARAQDTATPDMIARFAATLTAHDMDGFAALFAADYVNYQTSAATPPPPAGRTPKELSVAFFAARVAGMPDLVVSVETSMASPGRVAASFVYSGTHGGTYFGIPPTGRHLRFTSCDIFTVRDGLFTAHWGMGDIAGTLAQLKA